MADSSLGTMSQSAGGEEEGEEVGPASVEMGAAGEGRTEKKTSEKADVVAAEEEHSGEGPKWRKARSTAVVRSLFRSPEDERGPSRTRPKDGDLPKRSPTRSAAARRSRTTSRAKRWHSTRNPLYQDEEASAPLYVFAYETLLSQLWPPFNYFRLHLLYICLLSIFGGLALYVSQLGLIGEMSYLDALVHGVSASTQTGLVKTNFAVFSRLGQVILAGVMLLGNGVLITLAPVVTRLYYWHKFSNRHNRSDEYYALWQLLVIVPTYYGLFVGLGWVVLGVYAAAAPDALALIDKNDNHPAWWGLFHSMSAFGNCGYSTFADSMVQWQTHPLPLIVMSILILVGNTAFPLLMRLIVYTLWRTPFLKRSKHVYRYMLDHPRRCFTHLFPATETRWLLVLLVFLNSVEFLFELVLDWDNAAYLQLGGGYKVLNMYFQTIAIRTAGFNSVDLTKLSSAILWLYVGMMYISASPVAVTVRYTGQAQDQSGDDSIAAATRAPQKKNSVGSQVQNVFVKHFVFVFLAILFISMIEEIPLAADPNYSLFKVIFEVVSAYGTVGLSLGYGSNPTSFLGVMSGGSKFILALMMILGKHRNLPDSIDTAVTAIPQELLFEETDLDEMEVLSESDGGDDATQRQRHREHSQRAHHHHRHRHETSKKKTKRASRHTGEVIEEDKSEERKRQGPDNDKREESEAEEDEEGSQFDTGEEDIELGRSNRW